MKAKSKKKKEAKNRNCIVCGFKLTAEDKRMGFLDAETLKRICLPCADNAE